jgi:hypothetical protein
VNVSCYGTGGGHSLVPYVRSSSHRLYSHPSTLKGRKAVAPCAGALAACGYNQLGPVHVMNAITQVYPAILKYHAGPTSPRQPLLSFLRTLRNSETQHCSTIRPKACVQKKRNTPSWPAGMPLETPAAVCRAPDNAKADMRVRNPAAVEQRGSCRTS